MRRWIAMLVSVLALNALVPASAFGQYSSPSFQIQEYNLGSGGEVEAESTNFSAQGTVGDLAAGYGSSANYSLWAGYNTTAEPYLEMVVNPTALDFGTLNSGNRGSGTNTFYIRSYLSHGYVVHNASPPPKMGSYTMTTLNNAASTIGTEGFGINLKDNATPNIGANPSQYPDSSFSFGAAVGNYANADLFTYNQGDIIASAPSSSGRTDYTVSYVMTVSDVTPGGTYTMTHDIVVTATF